MAATSPFSGAADADATSAPTARPISTGPTSTSSLKRTSASTATGAPDYLPHTRLRREVRSARYDAGRAQWLVDAVDLVTGCAERYAARHLVAAAGENDERVVPGMDTFPGKVVHSAERYSAGAFKGKFVLVVGPSARQRLPVRSTTAAAARTPTAVRALCLFEREREEGRRRYGRLSAMAATAA
ncbi:Os11g0287100 [Oryza sativa Japonica Group]|uniref:indole-3-pyruvate monooxygenase n=2 Tax=Oryza sativa subsp. japonica TaxID=39947 RepID=A0A0P0Y1A0_ORYSJ|nr:hypothetical protein [Oryza sativa Japonica Group]AAX96855.1 hypothetical protein LOC_Os11g18380 [Oryza sativa Japonica Group]KAB8114967.1 hypothetical protein EE612_054811 [Oryza sativa]BAT13627.1 Os11g0287100 [Oryza sativa Japonica Group]